MLVHACDCPPDGHPLQVYRATWGQQQVAIKVVEHDDSTAPLLAAQLAKVAGLRHPNVVRTLGWSSPQEIGSLQATSATSGTARRLSRADSGVAAVAIASRSNPGMTLSGAQLSMDGTSSHSLDADIWELVAAARGPKRGRIPSPVKTLMRAASLDEQHESGSLLVPLPGPAGSSLLRLAPQPSLPKVIDSPRTSDADISIHELSTANDSTSADVPAADHKAQQGATCDVTPSPSVQADAAADTATDDGSVASACPAVTYQSLGRVEGSYSSAGGSSSYRRSMSGHIDCQETWVLLEACDKGSLADALQRNRWVEQLVQHGATVAFHRC